MPRGKRFRRPAVWVALSVVLTVLWLAVDRAGATLVVSRDVGPPDAIVMLASHEWERLPAAAALARRYRDAVVLLTVPLQINEYNCNRCGERVTWLGAEGVPEARVRVLRRHVQNTHDEAIATLEYEHDHPFRSLVVVTTPYHSRRALATFEHVFAGTPVAVGVFPASATSQAVPGHWLWHKFDRAYVAYEWAAILDYRVRYGVPLR
jgi:uncharacterized SAM-binding protein YcdF (DUF218 family)